MLTTNELRENRFFVVFLACMVALGPLSVDVYLPAIPSMAEYFGTSITTVNLTMSSFLIGNAIGQFFGGALSDQFGRKTIGLIGIGLFLISTLFILQASSIESVQMFRLTQAIGSGFASVICLAQVRDLYPKDEVMRRFANVMFIMFLAPLLAPIIGAILVQLGWHSIFMFLAVWALPVFAIYLFFIPETLKSKADVFSIREMFAGYIRVIGHRIDGRLVASRYILFGGISSGIFMTFLTNSALIYMQHFGADEFQFAIIFGAHALMLMIGNRSAVKLSYANVGLKMLRTM
ncbi:MAG: MFS transporter, partial [Acidiferrobacterales bacterium]|nr:MFS transporter [Acidiferrobacterales bacterium]